MRTPRDSPPNALKPGLVHPGVTNLELTPMAPMARHLARLSVIVFMGSCALSARTSTFSWGGHE